MSGQLSIRPLGPSSIPSCHGERQVRRSRLTLELLDLHLPLFPSLDQVTASPRAGSVQDLYLVPVLGSAHSEMMRFIVVQTYQVPHLPPDIGSRRYQYPHRAGCAATPHQPESSVSWITVNPVVSSACRNSSASVCSIPAKMARPPGLRALEMTGSRAVLTTRKMF